MTRQRDCAFLALVVLFVSLFYVTRIGFYSDDWSLVAFFLNSPRSSLPDLVRDSYAVHFASRPLQALYSATLFTLFGLNPLGYHLVNTAVLATAGMLLYLVIGRLHSSRLAALAVALLYVLLPNYSVARFWFAVYASPLALVLYLLSTWADLRSASATRRRLVGWRLLSFATLVASTMAYEIVLPLFLLNPVVVWLKTRRMRDLLLGVPNWLALVAIGLFKATNSHRMQTSDGALGQIIERAATAWRLGFADGDYGLNVWAALEVNFVDHLARLPLALLRSSIDNHQVALPLAASCIVGTASWRYLATTTSTADGETKWGRLALAGLATFAVGYSIFLTNQAIQITPLGVGNRTSIVAALGVSLVVVGVAGLLAARRIAATIGVIAGICTFSVVAQAAFWAEAYARERAIVEDVAAHVPRPVQRQIFLLAGVCRYHGPAVVFESSWDLEGALRIRYGRRDLMADVVSPSFVVERSGVATYLYDERYEYAYGPDLLLYDARAKRSFTLVDEQTTRRALEAVAFNPDRDCPPAKEGVGELRPLDRTQTAAVPRSFTNLPLPTDDLKLVPVVQ